MVFARVPLATTTAQAHLATITVRLNVGSTSCTTCSHSELAHSTDDCCRNRISLWDGAACCRTMRMMSSGVESASPFRALRMNPGVSIIVRLAQ